MYWKWPNVLLTQRTHAHTFVLNLYHIHVGVLVVLRAASRCARQIRMGRRNAVEKWAALLGLVSALPGHFGEVSCRPKSSPWAACTLSSIMNSKRSNQHLPKTKRWRGSSRTGASQVKISIEQITCSKQTLLCLSLLPRRLSCCVLYHSLGDDGLNLVW